MFRHITERAQLVRSYYAGFGKSAIIIPAAFLTAMSIGVVALGLIFFAKDALSATPAHIGWLAGTWSLSYVVGCLAIRPAFACVLPRYLIVGSSATMGALVLGMSFSSSLAQVFVLNSLFGVATGLFWPPIMGWLSTNIEGERLGRVISWFNLSWCTGNVIAPFLCGWLSEKGVLLPLFAGSALSLVTAAYVGGAAAALPGVRAEARNTDAVPGEEHTGGSSLLRYPGWVGMFPAFFAAGIIRAVFPVAALDVLLLSKTTIGALLLVPPFATGLLFVVLGRTRFWHFRATPMLAGQLLGCIAFLGLACTRSVWVIIPLLVLAAINGGMAYTFSMFHGISGSRDRAQRMAIHESIIGLGFFAGPVVGGMVYQAFSIGHVYLVTAGLTFGLLVVQALLARWALRHAATT